MVGSSAMLLFLQTGWIPGRSISWTTAVLYHPFSAGNWSLSFRNTAGTSCPLVSCSVERLSSEPPFITHEEHESFNFTVFYSHLKTSFYKINKSKINNIENIEHINILQDINYDQIQNLPFWIQFIN